MTTLIDNRIDARCSRLAMALCCGWALLTTACSSESADNGAPQGTVAESCDATKRPILFVHGIMGGSDNFELQAQRFTSNGYCRAAIRGFDYDATYLAFGGAPASATQDTQAALDAAVDAFRAESGFDTIDLVGHSYGTAMSAQYLSDAGHAAKIAHYAQAAGGGIAEPVAQVNLSSDGDHVAGPRNMAAAGPNGAAAQNPDIGYQDHLAVLTCKESFAAMYELFNGAPPASPDVVREQHIEVSGFYKNFSDNTPHAGVKLAIYQVDSATGARLHDKADFEFTTDAKGSFGPFVARPDARYEFYEPEAGEPPAAGQPGRPQHTYRGPFLRSTHLMYLKALPKLGSFAANLIVGKIPYTDSQTGFIIQNTHRAMISRSDPGGHGVDSLTVNGSELLTADVAPETGTLIALFGFDANSDGQSQLSPVPGFAVPFLNAIDLSLSTAEQSPIELIYDQVSIHIPRWKSDTEGSSLVVIDN